MKYRNVAWREIDRCVETVGRAIRAARFRPDCIVAVLKGGLIPARLLSDFFGSIEIYPIRVKAYAGTRKLARVRLEPFRYPIGRKNVLLVDDIHDSGQTLQKVIRHLQRRRPRALRTAALFYKRQASHPPDFHARTVAPDVWVVFPWERNTMKNVHGSQAQIATEPAIKQTPNSPEASKHLSNTRRIERRLVRQLVPPTRLRRSATPRRERLRVGGSLGDGGTSNIE